MLLTNRQLDVLAAIKNYRHKHGISPTMQEMAGELGLCKETIFAHVVALENKGAIRRDRTARSIEIVDDVLPPVGGTTLMLLGSITGDSPIDPVLGADHIDLDRMFDSRSGVYALCVRGSSFEDEHLQDGDCVVVERREKARNGERVVALLNGGIYIRRYYKSGTETRLQPTVAGEKPRIVTSMDRFSIVGVVIGMVREARAA